MRAAVARVLEVVDELVEVTRTEKESFVGRVVQEASGVELQRWLYLGAVESMLRGAGEGLRACRRVLVLMEHALEDVQLGGECRP